MGRDGWTRRDQEYFEKAKIKEFHGSTLTAREKDAVVKHDRLEKERLTHEILENIPIQIWDDIAIGNNPDGLSEHVIRNKFRELGIPVFSGANRSGKTWNLFDFLEWFMPRTLSSMSPDRTGTSTDSFDSFDDEYHGDESLINQLTLERIRKTREERRMLKIKIAREQGNLVPIKSIIPLFVKEAENLHKFGDLLVQHGSAHLVDQFNIIVNDMCHRIKNADFSEIPETDGKPEQSVTKTKKKKTTQKKK